MWTDEVRKAVAQKKKTYQTMISYPTTGNRQAYTESRDKAKQVLIEAKTTS